MIALKFVVVLTVLILFGQVQSYRILCAFPTISQSHFIVMEALMIGLAEKGHDVSVISSHPPAEPIDNYRHIFNKRSELHEAMIDKFTEKPGSLMTSIKALPTMLDFAQNEIRQMLQNREVQQIMEKEKFDLIIIEGWVGDPLHGLGQHFNCPIVQFSSLRASDYFLDHFNNPIGNSYAANALAEFAGPMDFKHRVANMLLFFLSQPLFMHSTYKQKKLYNEIFPQPKFRSYHEARRNVSAIFVAQHFTEVDVRPLFPTIIEIGGIHLKDKMNPVEPSLAKWMDKSTNGVILFSLGSNMKCSKISPDILDTILSVFKQLKENVLWKCETKNLGNIPENVKILKWLPQTDVLQHNNTKLFVTHGGLGSVTEARYYAVPLVVISLFADQMANGARVQHEQWGLRLNFLELTRAKLFTAIREVMDKPNYHAAAKYRSNLYRDRPLTALENGIFWIEYIIRHRGAKHMLPNAMNLNFFQLHSVDVLGFLLVVILLGVYINYRILKFLLKRIIRKMNKPKID